MFPKGNDLLSIIKFSQILFYADDIKIFRAIISPFDFLKIQRGIEAFDNWSRANGLPEFRYAKSNCCKNVGALFTNFERMVL